MEIKRGRVVGIHPQVLTGCLRISASKLPRVAIWNRWKLPSARERGINMKNRSDACTFSSEAILYVETCPGNEVFIFEPAAITTLCCGGVNEVM